MKQTYIMGARSRTSSWRNSQAQQLTFVVTQECNLACKYCYMIGKNKDNKMTIETAKAAVDFFIDKGKDFIDDQYIVLDFIGGEPLLEIDLIDEIVDYFKIQAYQKKSIWFGKYRISLGTNGVLYNDDKVQKFISKNAKMTSVGITIDGTKKKHDLQRIFPDGSGSYEIVVENVKLLLNQSPGTMTKVTIGHEDIPFLKESIIHLWDLGLHDVPANVVFEDAWQDGDAELFEQQLLGIADYVWKINFGTKLMLLFFQIGLDLKKRKKI